METIRHMEETKMAAVVHLKAFDFALIPHTNVKNGIHIIGLKVSACAVLLVRFAFPGVFAFFRECSVVTEQWLAYLVAAGFGKCKKRWEGGPENKVQPEGTGWRATEAATSG